jgi:hypothetical protein
VATAAGATVDTNTADVTGADTATVDGIALTLIVLVETKAVDAFDTADGILRVLVETKAGDTAAAGITGFTAAKELITLDVGLPVLVAGNVEELVVLDTGSATEDTGVIAPG